MAGLPVTDLEGMRGKVLDWADRTDLADSLYDDFINIAIDKANRFLRLEDRVVIPTLPVTDGQVNVPDSYLETKNIFVEANDRKWALERKSDAEVQALKNRPYGYTTWDTYQGYPSYFARSGSVFNLAPNEASIDEVELAYWAEVEALVDNTDTNWLITDATTAILYGSLVELSNYIMDEEAAAQWDAKFAAELQLLQTQSDEEKWSGNTISISL